MLIYFKVVLTTDCKYDGVNLIPSTYSAMGVNRRKDMIVITEKRVILSKDSWSRTNKLLKAIKKK